MATDRHRGEARWRRRADQIAALAMRRPKGVLAVAGIAFVAAVPIGATAFTALDPYEFRDPGTESAQAIDRLEEASGLRADGSVIVLVDATEATPGGRAEIAAVAKGLESVEGVAPLADTPGLPGGIVAAPSGERTYLVAGVDAHRESSEITESLEATLGDRSGVQLGGLVVADHQIAEQSEADLRGAELLAFP